MAKTPLPKTSNPATQALATVNIFFLEDLTKFTEKEIRALHGMGPKALGILKQHLKKLKLSFKK